MLHLGGAFSPKGTVRLEYKKLLHENRESRFSGMYVTVAELIDVMKQFVWCTKAYGAQVEGFWREIHSDEIYEEQLLDITT